jgi:hypothetical protein
MDIRSCDKGFFILDRRNCRVEREAHCVTEESFTPGCERRFGHLPIEEMDGAQRAINDRLVEHLHPDADSDHFRPAIPIESGHPFR